MTHYQIGHRVILSDDGAGVEERATVIEYDSDRRVYLVEIDPEDRCPNSDSGTVEVEAALMRCAACGMPHSDEHACEPVDWNYAGRADAS